MITESQTLEDVFPVVIGSLPRVADCSRARHGILYGLQSAFPGHLADVERHLDSIAFGRPSPLDGSVPVRTCTQVDEALADLMAQWVRGFVFCFTQYRQPC